VGAQKPKGLRTLFKTTQPPAKSTQNPTTNSGHNPKMDLCPKSTRKNEKKMKDLEKVGFRRKNEKNRNFGQMDGRWWVGWSERGRRWCCGGGGRGWKRLMDLCPNKYKIHIFCIYLPIEFFVFFKNCFIFFIIILFVKRIKILYTYKKISSIFNTF
jgi:hypothetical protein